MKRKFVAALALIAFAACDKPSSLDNTAERTKREQDTARDSENRNLAEKAKQMEKELRVRYRFYEAASGEFEGPVKIGRNEFIFSLRVWPSINIIETDRVRTLEEINQDINNLYLKAQAVFILNDRNAKGAYNECFFDQIKPELKAGAILLGSPESCRNIYMLSLADNKKMGGTSAEIKAMRESLAARVLAGESKKIPNFHVAMRIAGEPQAREVMVLRKEELR